MVPKSGGGSSESIASPKNVAQIVSVYK